MSNLVDYHGHLQTVQGKNYFIGKKSGEIVYPAGISLFWSSASSRYYNAQMVSNAKKQFNLGIIRIAMTAWSEWSDGYVQNPAKYVAHVLPVADSCIKEGIYCIIDWHCEGDNSPYVNQAKTFFADMAKRYSGVPNIIYEIWNEPKQQNWNQVIRPYCVQVIEEIRKYDKQALILCGTETWSQKVEDAAKNPIQDPNVAYVLHFYSNLHGPWLYRNKASLGVPVFVSEWGTPGEHANTKGFLDWLETNKVPHCSWALNNKAEPLSYIQSTSTDFTGPWDEKTELTDTGRIFLDVLKNWKGNKIPASSNPASSNPASSNPASSNPASSNPAPSNPVRPPTPSPTIQIQVEAEKFSKSSPEVKTQTTEDVGGGLNVGWITNRSWMTYVIRVLAGKYKVEYRVSSPTGGQLRIDTNAGRTIFGVLDIPITGGWQKWVTISHEITVSRDISGFGIFALKGGWNINWIRFTKID
jgi:endoglucanase